MKQFKGRVLYNKEFLRSETAAYYLIHIRAPDVAAGCRPGQFFMLQCNSDLVLRRPISIHDVKEPDVLSLLISIPIETGNRPAVKKGLTKICSLREGDPLDIIGPLGNGFAISPGSRNILIAAGGIGIAPLKYLAKTAVAEGKGVTLLIGARTKQGLYPGSLVPKGVKTIFATDDGSHGRTGSIADLVPDYLSEVDQVFACGPQVMYEAMHSSMANWPVKRPVQVSLEVRMGCGVGACYSCSIHTRQGIKRVCQDGPVFDINDIIWQEVRI